MPMFVDTSPPGQCIFCRLVAGEIPAARVWEDELTIAFMDIGQVNPGHVLVATRRHAATLFDITPQEAAAVAQTAQRVAHAVRAAFDPRARKLRARRVPVLAPPPTGGLFAISPVGAETREVTRQRGEER